MTVVSDNFNRADETPLAAPWTKVVGNSLNLATNVILGASSGTDSYYYYSGSATGADQFAEAAFAAPQSLDDWGPAVRINGAGHAPPAAEGYAYDITSGGGILRHFNGVFSLLASSSLVHVVGDVIRIEATGASPTTIKGFVNGVQKVSITDSSASQITGAGNGVGFFMFAMNAADNFNGGDLSATVTQYVGTRGKNGVKRRRGPGNMPRGFRGSGPRVYVQAAAVVPINDVDAGSDAEDQSLVVALSDTDASSPTNEVGTLVAVETTTDVSGAIAEASTVTVPIASTDVGGVTAEAAALIVQEPVVDVSGVVIEALTLVAQESAVDQNGTTTEAAALVAQEASADSNGATAEATGLRLAGSDSNGATTEATSQTAQESATDTNGALTEATQVGIPAAETNGATTEVSTLVAKPVATESGTVTSETATTNTPKVDTEAGTASEVISSLVKTTAPDAGSDTELGVVTAILSSQDNVAGPVNLLPGDFNTSNSWSAATSGTQTFTLDPVVFHEGTKSLKVVTDGLFPGQGASSPIVAIEAGQPYTAAVWINSQAGGENILVQVVERRSDNTFITSTDQNLTLIAGWQRVLVTRYMNAGGVKANLKVVQNFSATSPLTFWIDEAMLVPGLAAPTTYLGNLGGVTENATITYQATPSAQAGSATDTATIRVFVTALEANGATVETAAQVAALVATESGTVTEPSQVTVSLVILEHGGAVETNIIGLLGSDTAIGTDVGGARLYITADDQNGVTQEDALAAFIGKLVKRGADNWIISAGADTGEFIAADGGSTRLLRAGQDGGRLLGAEADGGNLTSAGPEAAELTRARN